MGKNRIDVKLFESKFSELYPGKRLLAVQLDGFSHRVIFDGGSSDSPVKSDSFSGCMPEGGWSVQAKSLLSLYPHHTFQCNAYEYVWVLPEDR